MAFILNTDMSANYYKKRILSTQMIVFGCFTVQSLNGCISTSYVFYGLVRTEDNLTDQTYFSNNLSSYFEGFDFRGSQVLVYEGLSVHNTPRVSTGQVSNGFLNTDSICWIVIYIHTFMFGTIQSSKGIKLVYLQLTHRHNFRSVPQQLLANYEILIFLIQIICWAPSISGLRALGSLQFFLKPAFTLQLGLNVHAQNEYCIMYTQSKVKLTRGQWSIHVFKVQAWMKILLSDMQPSIQVPCQSIINFKRKTFYFGSQ